MPPIVRLQTCDAPMTRNRCDLVGHADAWRSQRKREVVGRAVAAAGFLIGDALIRLSSIAVAAAAGTLGVWESVSVSRGRHEVDVGLDLLEVRETAGAAQAA